MVLETERVVMAKSSDILLCENCCIFTTTNCLLWIEQTFSVLKINYTVTIRLVDIPSLNLRDLSMSTNDLL